MHGRSTVRVVFHAAEAKFGFNLDDERRPDMYAWVAPASEEGNARRRPWGCFGFK